MTASQNDLILQKIKLLHHELREKHIGNTTRIGDVNARDNRKVLVPAWKDKRVAKAISTKQ